MKQDSDNKVRVYVGTSFTTLLSILLIALKLTNNIDWSWWWVLAPIWIPLSIGLIILAAIVVAWIIMYNKGK